MNINTIIIAMVRAVAKLGDDFENMPKKEKVSLFCGYIIGCLFAMLLISKGVDVKKYIAWGITILLLCYIEKRMKKD